ncbi:pyridoxal phosphate-dependent aminotransferase [Acuticoccus sp. MNP-M23]|uniref:pyridoxal phosphate-dependent aminotransferase n=1 Tax=Acuticoccus sp. MNP-M23 TaxID=3072793 RepID=UPI0028166AFD|nr:pyridoxal phosphate-dependent aminotransferase [Acuticoccus sp. MNP-M23]WMS42778.1 pyridoxal phosphate-dependent aminotransferase [Acuticoccus sp. MNP-M23]
MTTGLPFTPLAASLPSSVPFVGPETQERARGAPFRVRLGANESPFGPSPEAIAAMQAAAGEVWKYGDPENHDLREALSAHHGVAPARIGIGEGIDSLLQIIVRLFAGDGTPVVTSKGAYPTLLYHVAGFGAAPVLVPYRDDREDPDSLLAAVRETGAPLVYLANPDNPMGTWHGADAIARFLDALPEPTILMLDEAYGEFAPVAACLPMDFAHPRLIRLRTFSKAYGMAGARIGYAITSPEIATAFDKVRNHFGVNRVAQAGALAALGDGAHLLRVIAEVSAARDAIAEIGARHGLRAIDSATNFVALDTGQGGDFSRALVASLAAEGVFVRMPFVAPQDRCIRISAAPAAMLAVLDEALPAALDAARQRMPAS